MSSLPTPDPGAVAVWRGQARMMADEELHAWRDDSLWCIADAQADDDCPKHITTNSLIDSVSVIAAIDAEFDRRKRVGLSKPRSSLGWPREWIDELKTHCRIEDHVREYIHLTQRGKALVGQCPFHDDRSPSLVVWPESQRWRCFGCSIHGDVIAWKQAIEHIDFRAAVISLADITGVELPDQDTRPTKGVMRFGS